LREINLRISIPGDGDRVRIRIDARHPPGTCRETSRGVTPRTTGIEQALRVIREPSIRG
jgi:hypothetical protein